MLLENIEVHVLLCFIGPFDEPIALGLSDDPRRLPWHVQGCLLGSRDILKYRGRNRRKYGSSNSRISKNHWCISVLSQSCSELLNYWPQSLSHVCLILSDFGDLILIWVTFFEKSWECVLDHLWVRVWCGSFKWLTIKQTSHQSIINH